ncbi:MAG: carboxypeptidase regulatory-like domain-containing protein [Acidobacteriaceae bacterium]|nr:carboxypeptidase regulatory-like domain-containing protein [Acidobacteriaceae bacterium]
MSRRSIIVALAATLAAGAAFAQKTETDPNVFLGGPKYKKDKAPKSRSLKGTVVDDTGKPLEGALVTLTDTKTNHKLTFFTKNDGRYNFDDLSFSVDYEVMARFKDMQSEPRKLSQYDHTPNAVRILEVEEPGSAETKKQTTEAQK